MNCGSGSLAANQFATLKKSVPSAQSGTGMCIIDFVLFFAGEGDGHATVTAGGSTILTIDMLYYDTNGGRRGGVGRASGGACIANRRRGRNGPQL